MQNEEFIMRHLWTADFYPEDHDQRRDANNITKLFAINRVPPKSESKFKTQKTFSDSVSHSGHTTKNARVWIPKELAYGEIRCEESFAVWRNAKT